MFFGGVPTTIMERRSQREREVSDRGIYGHADELGQ